MALKLFCTACQKFIKEVSPQEASKLEDEIICDGCKKFTQGLLDNLNSEYQKQSRRLSKIHNEGVQKLESIIRKVVKG